MPPDLADHMSYCDPAWVSDYYFTNALRFRLVDTVEVWAGRFPDPDRLGRRRRGRGHSTSIPPSSSRRRPSCRPSEGRTS